MIRVFALATFLVIMLGQGCAAPESLEQTTAALTTGSCTSIHPAGTVDVSSSARCVRYWLPVGPYGTYYVDLGGEAITSVYTGQGAAAWVCAAQNPIGVTATPYAPCWAGGVRGDVHTRVRGAGGPELGRPYASTFQLASGLSAVLSSGHLPGPPACAYTQFSPPQYPLWSHPCGIAGDDGQELITENNDPTDSTTCCQIRGTWPDGTDGAPCSAHADGHGGDGDYATVIYQCP